MSKYDDIVRETVLEVLEEIDSVIDEVLGGNDYLLDAIRERLSDKFNVEVNL